MSEKKVEDEKKVKDKTVGMPGAYSKSAEKLLDFSRV